jgi:hypothetical protein
MALTKKISLKRFQEKSRQVFKLVNTQGMDVIVYDDRGPLAKLSPFMAENKSGRLKTLQPANQYSDSPMDRGGIWALSDSVRRAIGPAKTKTRAGMFSLGGLFKAARASVFLPLISRI